MKCPFCGAEMIAGGIVAGVIPVYWIPQEKFDESPVMRKIITTGIKSIGKSSVIFGETKISGAYYCEGCNKIIGAFDVTN